MKRSSVASMFCIAGLLVFGRCTTPNNPYTDPNNVEIALIDQAESIYTIGDTVHVHAAVFLPDLIDRIEFAATSGWDTTISLQSNGISHDTLSLSYVLNWPYFDTLSGVAFPKGAHPRRDSLIIEAQGLSALLADDLFPLYERKEGTSCSLSISARGTEPLTYTWFRDNEQIQSNQNSDLVFASITMRDSGLYRCVASNPWGADTSQYALVRILAQDAPEAPAHFAATHSTDAFIEFQWGAVSGAQAYRIYRDTADNTAPSYYRQTQDTIFVETNPGEFYYWVTAVRDSIESFRSNIVYTGTANHPPAWSEDSLIRNVQETESLTIDLTALCNDQNAGDSLRFSAEGLDSRATIRDGAVLVLAAPAGDSGTFEGSLIVSDGELSDTVYVLLEVMPRYHTIATASQHGSIRLFPAAETYRYGDTVSIAALPDSGYTFREWRGDITAKNDSAVVIMTSDKNIQAVFWPSEASQCIALAAGASINQVIEQYSPASQRPALLCPSQGLYDESTIEIQGKIEIIIE